MRKFYLFLVIALFATLSAMAQVYDGITQPTRYRVWLPVTMSTNNSSDVSFAPFIGFRQDIGERFSVTPVIQYNVNKEKCIPQIWLNYNIAKKLYVLSRSIYDTKEGEYKHTMSATYKLPEGFMIDGTWENMYDGRKFADTDRLQFLGGYACKLLVANAGYSCRNKKGLVANLRIKVTDLDWLQLKYDAGAKNIQVSTALQFN